VHDARTGGIPPARFEAVVDKLPADFETMRAGTDGSEVTPLRSCLGRPVQNRLDVGSCALFAKMPFLRIRFAGHDGQLLLFGLVLAAEIANVNRGHEKSPFLLAVLGPCKARAGRRMWSEASSQFVRRGALAEGHDHPRVYRSSDKGRGLAGCRGASEYDKKRPRPKPTPLTFSPLELDAGKASWRGLKTSFNLIGSALPPIASW